MSIYDNIALCERADDEIIVTCAFCDEDCPLCCLSSGCCPECASLIATIPAVHHDDPLARRSRLVCVTRRAFVRWGEAVALKVERCCALRPSRACIDEANALVSHYQRRYNRLESALEYESGLEAWQVYNDISNQYPLCTRLLTSGL